MSPSGATLMLSLVHQNLGTPLFEKRTNVNVPNPLLLTGPPNRGGYGLSAGVRTGLMFGAMLWVSGETKKRWLAAKATNDANKPLEHGTTKPSESHAETTPFNTDFCPSCFESIDSDSEVCRYCGKKLATQEKSQSASNLLY